MDVTDNIILNNIYILLVEFKESISSIINLNYIVSDNSNNIFIKDLKSMIDITNDTTNIICGNIFLNELLTMMKNIDYNDLLIPQIKNELCENSFYLLNKYEFNVNNSDDIIIILRFIIKGYYFFEINTIEENTLIKYYFQISYKMDNNSIISLTYFEHDKYSDKNENNESCKNAILKYFENILLKTYPNKNIIFFDLEKTGCTINKISFNLNLDLNNKEYDFNFI